MPIVQRATSWPLAAPPPAAASSPLPPPAATGSSECRSNVMLKKVRRSLMLKT